MRSQVHEVLYLCLAVALAPKQSVLLLPKLIDTKYSKHSIYALAVDFLSLCSLVRNSSGNRSSQLGSQAVVVLEIQTNFTLSLHLLFAVLSMYNFGSSLAVLLELLRFVVHVTFLW